MAKILVIEDDYYIRQNILDLLKIEGFEVFEALNGAQGVQIAKEKLPDLVLSDIMMPGMDGYQVLVNLRQDEKTRAIPFIFLSAKEDRPSWRQGMNYGADDYLVKPASIKELRQAIRTRLDRQAAAAHMYSQKLQTLEEKFRHLINTDSLTGLPNINSFRNSFKEEVTNLNSPGYKLALILIGLGRFEKINQALGFGGGNELLKAVARRLTNFLESHNQNLKIVASVQTGKFAILSTSESQAHIVDLANLILKDLSEPFVIEGQEVYITPFMGIALSNNEKKDFETLLKQAEVALTQTLRKVLPNLQIYNETMECSSLEHLLLESNLRHAVGRNELELYYQPQVALATNQVVGMEALVRWHHPLRGMVSPAEFIPVAEETGLIIPIGQWVLRQACAQAKAWQLSGLGSLQVAVNLSAHQFNQPDLGDTIEKILKETGLDPDLLELELTESAVIHDLEQTIKTLNRFKAVGIKVSIDDFGTGYSSLSNLKNIPFNNLKIDQSFVRQITSKPEYATIVRAIIEMAHDLDLKVVAEGVETKAERAFLEQFRCDLMQGY